MKGKAIIITDGLNLYVAWPMFFPSLLHFSGRVWLCERMWVRERAHVSSAAFGFGGKLTQITRLWNWEIKGKKNWGNVVDVRRRRRTLVQFFFSYFCMKLMIYIWIIRDGENDRGTMMTAQRNGRRWQIKKKRNETKRKGWFCRLAGIDEDDTQMQLNWMAARCAQIESIIIVINSVRWKCVTFDRDLGFVSAARCECMQHYWKASRRQHARTRCVWLACDADNCRRTPSNKLNAK